MVIVKMDNAGKWSLFYTGVAGRFSSEYPDAHIYTRKRDAQKAWKELTKRSHLVKIVANYGKDNEGDVEPK